MGLYAALATTDLARASPPFETDVIEIANAGGVRIIAVAEYGDIDQVRRRGILPDLGIDAREVDLLVKPAANPVVTGIGNEVRETADVFVFLRVQPIAQITPWRASRRDLSQTEETAAPGDPRLRACDELRLVLAPMPEGAKSATLVWSLAETVCRFDGFVAKYMGDGVLIYFGYPQAHEDDALPAAPRVGSDLGIDAREVTSRPPSATGSG